MQYQWVVSGMSCGHCEKAVTQAIRQLDPNAVVQIDRASGQVRVDSSATQAALEQAIRDEGYGITA